MKNILSLLKKGTLVAALVTTVSVPAYASTDEETAKEMATLFRAARGVIAKNQAHINDPAIGDKGLSSDAVVAKAKENYKTATGHDLVIDMATREGQFMQAELDAIAAVMAEAQPLINEEGKGFKGFLPAVFAGQVATKTSEALKGKAELKLTAPKEFVRNRSNRPDDWEGNVIESKFKSDGWAKDQVFSEITQKDGKSAFRLIMPEYYAEGCLACHGEPKGEMDITGGAKEGGKLGDLGGAISVTLYQ